MRRFITMLAVLMLTQACTHKDLCYDHPHTIDIDVEFDWSKAPDGKPATMSVYLFPEDGGEAQRYEFIDHTKGKMRVLPGRYKAICLNSDTRNISFSDRSSYESCSISTKDTDLLTGLTTLGVRSENAPMARGTEDERIAMSPDSIWTGRIDEIVADSLCKKLTFSLEEAFLTIRIVINNIENIEYLSAANGALSSMSGGWYIGQNVLTEENVTIPFNLEINKKENRINGELLIFGHCPTEETNHLLTTYCIMADGSKFYYTYDVTRHIHESQDGVITISLDNLPLPTPQPGDNQGGGGFQPTVGGWESVDIGIKM